VGYSNLNGLDLSDTVLTKANLIGADLTWTNFKGADLSGAHLSDAKLAESDLRYAKNLTCEQLQEAIINKQTLLPKRIIATWLSDTQVELIEILPS
jgi:uncharacterized protein YjbI with pentapeptide repeats